MDDNEHMFYRNFKSKLEDEKSFPPVPVFHVDTRCRVKPLMSLVAKCEMDEKSIQAGSFVIRIVHFEGLEMNELMEIKDGVSSWTRQSWSRRLQTLPGVYLMNLTDGIQLCSDNNANTDDVFMSSVALTTNEYWSRLGSSSSLYAHDFESSIHSQMEAFPWDMNDLGHLNILPKVTKERRSKSNFFVSHSFANQSC